MSSELKGKVIQSYWRKDTLREVYLDNNIILKHYVVKPGTRRFPKPWLREDKALKAMEGRGFPKSYGYDLQHKNGGLDVVFRRGYLEGNPITRPTPEDVTEMAETLALIHRQGVITDDAKIENFIKDHQDKIKFFDFGAAFVFRRKTPLYYTFIGREMVKFLRLTLSWDMSLWKLFRQQYQAAHSMPLIGRFFVKTGFFLTLNLRRMRKRTLYP